MRGDALEVEESGRVEVRSVNQGLQAFLKSQIIFHRLGPADAVTFGDLLGGLLGRCAFNYVIGELGGRWIQVQDDGGINDQDAGAVLLQAQMQTVSGSLRTGLEMVRFSCKRLNAGQLIAKEIDN